MKGMPTLEGCLGQEYILLKIPQKAISMCMGSGVGLGARHTRTGPVTSATGETLSFCSGQAVFSYWVPCHLLFSNNP